MKGYNTDCNERSIPYCNSRRFLLPFLILILFTVIHLCTNNQHYQQQSVSIGKLGNQEIEKKCNIFTGEWVPYPKGPYYTNTSCNLIIDQQNCMKFGRPDTEYMKWRWKPDECELPLFDPFQFLDLVRGKSMAFLGDSVGRNQMQSLLCLLSSVANPEDISNKYSSNTDYFKRWFYAEYNFTLAALWSPFLVEARDADSNGHSLNSLMSLHLDKADDAWVSQIQNFDYVIISAGQWFFRPLIYQENNKIAGCHICHIKNITSLPTYYGYRKAFRTTFQTLQRLKNYKGITFLRTFSPAHFENGDWDKGGNCERTRPFTSQEVKLDGYIMELYLTQVEELKAAQKQGIKKGLKFRLLDTTEIMLRRPDGHPNHYGRSLHKNTTVKDCVHWCLPGPIDTWNEFLLHILKTESGRSY